MKKVITIFGVMLIFSLTLISCGDGSIESDAKKYAELQCKGKKRIEEAQKLIQTSSSDPNTVKKQMDEMIKFTEETNKLNVEAAAFFKEIETKYTSESDKQKFSEALLKEEGNCK